MPKGPPRFELARVYDAPAPDGRFRVLVDRLWPRGVKKGDLKLDAWMKQLAPSSTLRRWFNHDPQRWDEFCKRFFKELEANSEQVAHLLKAADKQMVLLLYGARDEKHNNAVALKAFLEKHAAKLKSSR